MNTPHNPTGRVFSREELEAIAEIVRENPRVSDEQSWMDGYGSCGSDALTVLGRR